MASGSSSQGRNDQRLITGAAVSVALIVFLALIVRSVFVDLGTVAPPEESNANLSTVEPSAQHDAPGATGAALASADESASWLRARALARTSAADLRKKAEAGDEAAMFVLAQRYEVGQGLPLDYFEAATWYGKAAEHGNGEAARVLNGLCVRAQALSPAASAGADAIANDVAGSLDRDGLGGVYSAPESARLFRKAAERGEPAAMVELARALTVGEGVDQNVAEANQWREKAIAAYRKQAEAGDLVAMRDLASIHLSGDAEPKPEEAAKWLLRASEKGDATAMVRLAKLRLLSPQAVKDEAQGLAWCNKAVELDSPEAMLLLADLHAHGQGVAKDLKTALQWRRQVAEKGDPRAMYLLAAMLEAGQGAAENETEALKWYEEAARLGEPAALTQIGKRYVGGQSNGSDQTAIAYFQRAASLGDDKGEAAFQLGMAYAEGRGVERNERQAHVFFRQAASQDHPEALFQLGQLISQGLGVPKDPAAAADWYLRAAHLDHKGAMKCLSEAYQKGEGVEQSEHAAAWWKAKAQAGPGQKEGVAKDSENRETATPLDTLTALEGEPPRPAFGRSSGTLLPIGAAPKPLAEKDLSLLVELTIAPAAIVSKVQAAGLAVEVDEAVIARLKTAGAPETVIKALREALAAKAKPATSPVLTYENVLRLLSLGVEEQSILRRHAKSPAALTLNASQMTRLKQAGASENMLATLTHASSSPNPADSTSSDAKRDEGDKQVIAGWGMVVDSLGNCTFRDENHTLTITVPGEYRDLWPVKGQVNAPLVLQEVAGDFTIEVLVEEVTKAEPDTVLPALASKASFHAGSLVIWQDAKNFVRFDRTDMHKEGRATNACYLHIFQDGARIAELAPAVPDRPTHLRLARKGDHVTAAYSQDGAKTWTNLAEQKVKLADKLKAGVSALNNTSRENVVRFADLKL